MFGKIIDVKIETDEIQLDQFLKWIGVISSGGEIKSLLLEKIVVLNDNIETARRRKLKSGDVVELKGVGAWRLV